MPARKNVEKKGTRRRKEAKAEKRSIRSQIPSAGPSRARPQRSHNLPTELGTRGNATQRSSRLGGESQTSLRPRRKWKKKTDGIADAEKKSRNFENRRNEEINRTNGLKTKS